MKGIDIFCASQSSTSTIGGTTTTMEAAGSLSSSSIEHRRGPAIDRYNPIIHDQSRIVKTEPQKQNTGEDSISSKINSKTKKNKQHKVGKEEKRRSNAVAFDDVNYAKATTTDSILNWRRNWSCMNPGGFISPPGSSRYLLSEKALLNVQSDSDPVLKLVPPENSKPHAVRKDESDASIHSSSTAPVPYQVVLLRVSLHCRGCVKKLRKHISTIQGVSSFSIDFAAKKVTVEGNVTPLEVLASISKVKNAQLWTTTSSTTFPVDIVPAAHTISEMKTQPEDIIM